MDGVFEKVDRRLLERIPIKRFSSSLECRMYVSRVCYPGELVVFLVQGTREVDHIARHVFSRTKRTRGGEQGSSSSSVKIVVKGYNWISLPSLQGNLFAPA